MAISHFKITRLPSSDIISMIGADALQKDQLYLIDRQSELSFRRIDSLNKYYALDSFEYQVYEQETQRYGAPAIANLRWQEDDLSTPIISENKEVLLYQEQSISLLSLMPINKAVEFVEIVSISGVNNAKLKGMAVVAGDKLSPSELVKATFKVILGGGYPYCSIEYKVGRGNQTAPEIYVATINVDTVAQVVISDQIPQTYSLDDENGIATLFTQEDIYFRVENAASLADIELEVDVNFPWTDIAAAESESNVFVSGQIFPINSQPQLVQINAETISRGILLLNVSTQFKYNDQQSYSGSVTVRIISINGATTGISTTNNVVTAQITR